MGMRKIEEGKGGRKAEWLASIKGEGDVAERRARIALAQWPRP
jgi:hypothetical protein